jgi:MFS family permease
MSFYNEAWQWNISGAILGVAGSVCVNTMNQTITGNWFNKKAGLAVGIAASFSGVGGTFFTPIVASIMEKVGWRITYLIIAAFCALLVFPFSIFVIRYKPSDLGLKPYGWNDKDSQLIEKPVVKSQNMTTLGIRKLPILVLGIGAGFVALSSTFYQHAPAYASSIGYSLMVGSIVYSVLFFGNILGKLGFGYLVDRFGVKKIGPAPIIVSMSGLLSILLVGKSSQFLLMCASFLFGTIYCFVNIIVSMTVRISYGNERFTTIFPLVSLISTLIGSTGSIIIGYLYDYFGSYFVAILACIGFYILALLLFCVFLGMKKQSQIRIYPTTP